MDILTLVITVIWSEVALVVSGYHHHTYSPKRHQKRGASFYGYPYPSYSNYPPALNSYQDIGRTYYPPFDGYVETPTLVDNSALRDFSTDIDFTIPTPWPFPTPFDQAQPLYFSSLYDPYPLAQPPPPKNKPLFPLLSFLLAATSAPPLAKPEPQAPYYALPLDILYPPPPQFHHQHQFPAYPGSYSQELTPIWPEPTKPTPPASPKKELYLNTLGFLQNVTELSNTKSRLALQSHQSHQRQPEVNVYPITQISQGGQGGLLQLAQMRHQQKQQNNNILGGGLGAHSGYGGLNHHKLKHLERQIQKNIIRPLNKLFR